MGEAKKVEQHLSHVMEEEVTFEINKACSSQLADKKFGNRRDVLPLLLSHRTYL